jgi:hypothetical protein
MGARMGKSIISLLVFVAAWSFGGAIADEIKLSDSAPDRYVVRKGDTLWDISTKFLKDPWRWPDIWGLNKEEIKNPHWIYPGDVVVLDFTGKTPHLRKEGGRDGNSGEGGDWRLMEAKLSPAIRKLSLGAGAISSIPASSIQAFLVRPLVVEDHELNTAPTLVAGPENRVVLSAGDTAFAKGLVWESEPGWSIFRPGRVFTDPDTNEVLGREAVYLGDAQVSEFGEVSTIVVSKATREIAPGDRLAKAPPTPALAYVPHAPQPQLKGRVMAGPEGRFSEIAPLQVVVINRGRREGIEIGHVLALYRDRPSVIPANASNSREKVRLPAERYGTIFVFRVFEKLSYALVMTSTQPVNVLDVVQAP